MQNELTFFGRLIFAALIVQKKSGTYFDKLLWSGWAQSKKETLDFGGDLNLFVDSGLFSIQDSLPLRDSIYIKSFVFTRWQQFRISGCLYAVAVTWSSLDIISVTNHISNHLYQIGWQREQTPVYIHWM